MPQTAIVTTASLLADTPHWAAVLSAPRTDKLYLDNPQRSQIATDYLQAAGYLKDPRKIGSRVHLPNYGSESLKCFHTFRYLRDMERACRNGRTRLVPIAGSYEDLLAMDRDHFRVATATSNACIATAFAILRGEVQNGLVVAWPPGHHGYRRGGSRYCPVNHAAVCAANIQKYYRRSDGTKPRIAIIDFDAHAGDGTLEGFRNDPSVFVGDICVKGAPDATVDDITDVRHATFRRTVYFGAQKGALLYQMEPLIDELIKHGPIDLVICSAGFDLEYRDPTGLGNMRRKDFEEVDAILLSAAQVCAGGRIMFITEGGYDPTAFAEDVTDLAGQLTMASKGRRRSVWN